MYLTDLVTPEHLQLAILKNAGAAPERFSRIEPLVQVLMKSKSVELELVAAMAAAFMFIDAAVEEATHKSN